MSLRRLCPAVCTCLCRLNGVLFCFALLICVSTANLFAQTTNATINGQITDPQGRVVPGTDVDAVNIGTNVIYPTKTNASGIYTIPNLPPGPYRIHVRRDGFKEINMTDLVLHVQDTLEQNFALEVGSTSESITVQGNGLNINTTDASVSTVVDRQFVDTMPLNGRSFQSLILLAPGVATATPQSGASQGVSGEFSVNGQRADANSFTVDGVSANNSPNPFGYAAAGNAGGLQATTALGTTQALVSVDALQEFKIQTSTYSAEYGRGPGAQVSFQTRPGTNDWHGSAFDYLRNDIFDANNWFNDHSTPPTRKPEERQNDFGGTVGGPLGIPSLYSGRDRTFFFFSYEGLRLIQPQPAAVYYVPSNGTNNTATYANPLYENLRANAPSALQPVLDAFPLPNCTTAINSQCVDPGNGLSPFIQSTSLSSNLDAISARFDERIEPWLTLFFRYSSANSSAETLASTLRESVTTHTNTFTLGADGAIGRNITNQFRLNYSPATASGPYALANYGGAVPVDLQALSGVPPNTGYINIRLSFPGYSTSLGQNFPFTKQHQWNLVDTLTQKLGKHLVHVGLDYRRTSVTTGDKSPLLQYTYSAATSVLTNSPQAGVTVAATQYPEYTNFSAFAQDDWRIARAINLSLGLRWELNPPPTVTAGPESRTVNGSFDNPSSLTLAPAGTPLYHTTYYNFAPRLGMAVVLHDRPGRELVVRAGGGIFYDTGQQANSVFGQGNSPGTGFSVSYPASTANAFPLTSTLWNIPLEHTLTPPYSGIVQISQHLQLPYSFQWNASMEQALGDNQSISIGYIGSNGRRLLSQKIYMPSNPAFSYIEVYLNGLSSSYNSLQVQYKRSLSRGLQVLAAYTWSHALDYESQDWSFFPYQRGASDFDIRSNFTGAFSYDLRKQVGSQIPTVLFGGWGADLRFTARTGFPVALNGNEFVDPTGNYAYSGLNVVPGAPVYLYGAQYPGGRRVNPAAFALPTGSSLGNAPRNFVRGFGETEVNFGVRRDFPLYERVQLQFRAEAFNLFNHPNFGLINGAYGNALFGQATKTLASSIGGLTSLYQQGGPRSLQVSLRMQF